MRRIGFLGAYSIDNTGDQLLGYAARQALAARVPAAEQALFAPALRGDIWRHAWDVERGVGVEIHRIAPDDGTAWARGLDALVVGGGELVRLEPDFRPFLLGEASDWDPEIPAAWNAVGAENAPLDLPDQRPKYRAIKRCCEALAYASVRNPATFRFVRRCGFPGPLPIVPDPTMLLGVPPPGSPASPALDRARGLAILRDSGVASGRPVLGVSLGAAIRDPRAGGFFKDLLEGLASARDAAVVLFPFGNVYGDLETQRLARRALPNATIVEAPLSALDRWRLVGALDLHVCARYHGMLAAFAQDVRFLVLDEYRSDALATSKIREFVASMGLEASYLCPFVSPRPRDKLARAIDAARGGRPSFAERRDALFTLLGAHYDALTTALGLA